MTNLNNNLERPIKKSNFFIKFNRSLHKWLGLIVSILILILSISGIMLNHRARLGYMPTINHEASGQISQGLPIDTMIMIALKAANDKNLTTANDVLSIDYRPNNMYAKVRFKDIPVSEVVVDSVTGDVLDVSYRIDLLLEKIHTGSIFGASPENHSNNFSLISDFAGVAVILVTFSGFYIWLYPKRRHSLN